MKSIKTVIKMYVIVSNLGLGDINLFIVFELSWYDTLHCI